VRIKPGTLHWCRLACAATCSIPTTAAVVGCRPQERRCEHIAGTCVSDVSDQVPASQGDLDGSVRAQGVVLSIGRCETLPSGDAARVCLSFICYLRADSRLITLCPKVVREWLPVRRSHEGQTVAETCAVPLAP
jgi:hypothetical protein